MTLPPLAMILRERSWYLRRREHASEKFVQVAYCDSSSSACLAFASSLFFFAFDGESR